jgi:hypothetical protein
MPARSERVFDPFQPRLFAERTDLRHLINADFEHGNTAGCEQSR